jgi:hypothetical protein
MSTSKQQPKAQDKAPKTEKGALSDAALNKVSGGNMPTSVEHSAGRRPGDGSV